MDLAASILLVLIGIIIGSLISPLFASMRNKPEEDSFRLVPSLPSSPEEAVILWRESRQKLQVQAGGRVIRTAGELNESERERQAGYTSDLRI